MRAGGPKVPYRTDTEILMVAMQRQQGTFEAWVAIGRVLDDITKLDEIAQGFLARVEDDRIWLAAVRPEIADEQVLAYLGRFEAMLIAWGHFVRPVRPQKALTGEEAAAVDEGVRDLRAGSTTQVVV